MWWSRKLHFLQQQKNEDPVHVPQQMHLALCFVRKSITCSNWKFYTKIIKKILIWAFRWREGSYTVTNIQKDCRMFVMEFRKKMGCNKKINSQIICNKDQKGRSVMWLRRAFLGMTSCIAREQTKAKTLMEWKVCSSFLQMGRDLAFSYVQF